MTLHCHEKFHNNKILEIYPSHSVVPINLTLIFEVILARKLSRYQLIINDNLAINSNYHSNNQSNLQIPVVLSRTLLLTARLALKLKVFIK